MTRAKSIAAYKDVLALMDQILAGKGGTVTFQTEKEAYVARHRCYRARIAYDKLHPTDNPYDDLYILKAEGSSTLEFKLRSLSSTVEVKLNTIPPDEFEIAAQRLKNDIGL